MPGIWHDGFLRRWSGSSLISDSLLADAQKVAQFVTVAACLALGWACVTWVLSFASQKKQDLMFGLRGGFWKFLVGVVDAA